MKKVYVVTYGVYSDFGIEAIFSTREKAEQYLKDSAEIGYGQGYSELNDEILEYDLDADGIDVNKAKTYGCYFDPSSEKLDIKVCFTSDSLYQEGLNEGYFGEHVFYVKAKTIEAAKKIAREKAAIYKESYLQNLNK